MKHKIVLLLILLVSYINPVQAQYGEVLDVSDALQNALDVRTSAVKIVKDYLYRGLKVNYVSKENDENLSGGEFSLLKLEVYAQDHPELKGKVEKVAHQWKNLRALALQKPKKEKMQGLLKKLGVFLKDADDLIETIDESNNVTTLKYQKAANNMELLAQQLAFLYGMKVAGIQDPVIKHEIERCQADFQKDLDKTFFSGENTIDISNTLNSIQADWELAKRSTNNAESGHGINTIYVLMDKISDAARKSAILYQEKAKETLKAKK
ncbi:MAG TPA: hypothetical protein ENK64_00870 [Flavobacteriales bacterium]|nr:hypothetical protein [Flavobacteriales bacterium]